MIIFSQGNLLNGASLSLDTGALTDAATYPLAGLRDGYLQPECRVTPAGGTVIFKADLATAQAVNRCRVCAFNDGGVSITIQGNDTDSWGTPALEESLALNGRYGVAAFTPETYRWWRLVITGITESFFRLGEWQLANDTEFSRHPTSGSAGDSETWDVEELASAGGIVWSYLYTVQRRWSGLRFERLHEDRFNELRAVLSEAGYGGPLWLVLAEAADEEAAHTHFVANLTKELPRENAGPWHFHTTVSLAEVPEGIYVA